MTTEDRTLTGAEFRPAEPLEYFPEPRRETMKLKSPDRPVSAKTLIVAMDAIGEQLLKLNEVCAEMVLTALTEQLKVTPAFDAATGELVIKTTFESKRLNKTFTSEARCTPPGYKGTWAGRTASYRRGDSVTHRGALWFAVRDTANKPGDSDAWQMQTRTGA